MEARKVAGALMVSAHGATPHQPTTSPVGERHALDEEITASGRIYSGQLVDDSTPEPPPPQQRKTPPLGRLSPSHAIDLPVDP
jgi:hypothetical protein